MDIKLRYAKYDDIPVLKELWQICFGDRMRYIDVFFDRMFCCDDTVIAEVGKKVVGVVYLLNRSLDGKKIMYGYAIGVYPEFRGNNICEKMLYFIKEKAQKENCIFCLHPANEKLTHFYKKLGLNEMYYLKEVNYTGKMSDELYPLKNIDTQEFFDLRRQAFSNNVEWSFDALDYILQNGEIVKKISLQNKNLYFVISVQDDTLLIKETNATDDEIALINKSLMTHFDTDKTIYILQSKSTLHGSIKPLGLGFS